MIWVFCPSSSSSFPSINSSFSAKPISMDPRLYRAAVEGDISPLHEVIEECPIRAKPELLLHNITIQKNNVLHIAVRSSPKEFVKNVIELCPSVLAQPNSNGDTPLHIAAKEGILEMLYFLVQCLSNVKVVSGKATEELMKMKRMIDEYDLDRGGPLRAVPHILEASPLSVYSDLSGRTTLHQAIIANSLDNEVCVWAETFPEMIKKKDVYGWTPLHYASHFGFFKYVCILLATDKSSAYEPDKSGMYGHLIAAHQGNSSVIREYHEHCPDCFELLARQGRAALHIAAEAGEFEVVWFLLEKTHHHINLQDNRGYTPLLLASKNQNECNLASLRNHPKVHGNAVLGRQLEAFYVANEMPIQLQFEANCEQHTGTKTFHIGTPMDTKKAMQKLESHQSLEIISRAEDETPASQKVETHHSLEIVSSTSQEIKIPWDSKNAMQKVEASQILQLPSKENETGEARKDDVSRRLKDKASIHLLVATLIATVSFAAGINMPGGYENDGLANLRKKAAFQVFVVSNSLAFCFSAASIAIHFMIIIERRVINRAVLLLCALFLTFVGLVGMVTAFISGTIAALSASVALWVASSIVGCSFLLVFYVIIRPPFKNRRVSVDVKEGESQFLYKLTSALLSWSSTSGT